MKPCLIFDLDGTLVDSLPGIAASLNRALDAHGLPGHSDAMVRSFIGNGLRNLIARAAPQSADPSLIESMLALYRKDYELSWASGTHVYPGIHPMLDELRVAGFSISVLSNKVHAFTVEIARSIFPSVPFSAVLGQREGIPHKPHPAGALEVSNMIGTTPEKCVVIGDSTMDIETAANAGMRSIAVSWGYHDRDRLVAGGAEKIIDHPSELLPLLG